MSSSKSHAAQSSPAPLQKPKMARALTAADLQLADPDDEPGELRTAEVNGGTLADNVHALDWAQVTARGVDFGSRELDESSLIDTIVADGDWSNCNLRGSAIRRVEFRGVRMTGAIFAEATLRDVRFVGCRLDLANFRFSKCERVVFDDCQMLEMELQSSVLKSVQLLDCRMEGADITSCSFERSQIRGSSLEGVRGLLALRGVAIPWPEIVELAGGMSAAIGISILAD